MNNMPTSEPTVVPRRPAPSTIPGGEDFEVRDPFRSFVRVVRQVAFGPVRFFARMRRQGSYFAPLAFAVIVAVIGNGIGILASVLGLPGVPAVYDINRPDAVSHEVTVDIGALHHQFSVGEPFGGGIGATIVYGSIAVAACLYFIWMLYLAERMVIGRRNAGPETTFRIVAYSTVPELLAWVPFVGGVLGLYGVFLTVVGLREVHQTSTSQAVKGFVVALGLSVAAAIVLGIVVATFIVVFA